jgi:3-methyladenine DNA glycosylase AlkD
MTSTGTTPDIESTIAILQARLDTMGDSKTKAWWERYMKHVIPFRGIKMPVLRPVLFEWWDAQVAPHGLAFQKATAAHLFTSSWSEDKLAGVLAFEHLAPSLEVADLAMLEDIFQQGLLFDWNNTDWLCVKVLDKLVRRGLAFAEPIAGWTAQSEAPLWQRRAGAVAFVNIAKHGQEPPSSPQLWELMSIAAGNNVRSPERFMQTSVGWLVREMGKADAGAALGFAEEHRDRLSREALRYIVEKMPPDVQRQVLDRE